MSGRLSFSFPAAQAPPPSATSTAAADAITRLRVNRAPSRDRWPATVAERTKWFGARGYAGVTDPSRELWSRRARTASGAGRECPAGAADPAPAPSVRSQPRPRKRPRRLALALLPLLLARWKRRLGTIGSSRPKTCSSVLPRVCTARICARPLRSGRSTVTLARRRHRLRWAGSGHHDASGRLDIDGTSLDYDGSGSSAAAASAGDKGLGDNYGREIRSCEDATSSRCPSAESPLASGQRARTGAALWAPSESRGSLAMRYVPASSR